MILKPFVRYGKYYSGIIFLMVVCIAMPAIVLSIYQGNVYSEKAYVARGIGGRLCVWIDTQHDIEFAGSSLTQVEMHLQREFPQQSFVVKKGQTPADVIAYSPDGGLFLRMTCYPDDEVKQGEAFLYKESARKLKLAQGGAGARITMFALPLNPFSPQGESVALEVNQEKRRYLNERSRTSDDVLVSPADYERMNPWESAFKSISVECKDRSLYPKVKQALEKMDFRNIYDRSIDVHVTYVDKDFRLGLERLHTAGWGNLYLAKQMVISYFILSFTCCVLAITVYATIFSMVAVAEKRKREFQLFRSLGMSRKRLIRQIVVENTMLFLLSAGIACILVIFASVIVRNWVPSGKTVIGVIFARRVDFLGMGGRYLFRNAVLHYLIFALFTYLVLMFGTLRSVKLFLGKSRGKAK